MDKKELSRINDAHEEIESIRESIQNTNSCIDKLEYDIQKDYTFFRIEVFTYKGSKFNRCLSSSRLLGTKEVVRALKDAVSATKGYLHHLEKEFDRR